MTTIEKLTELFSRFPGIGTRQAGRFAYFLLRQSPSFRNTLMHELESLNKESKRCAACMRYFIDDSDTKFCAVCSSESRTRSQLMVLEKEIDIERLEQSGAYNGLYFILGGTTALSGAKRKIADKELLARLENNKDITEVILALSATVEGEYTARELREMITQTPRGKDIEISELGRGISTGSELEYADPDTLKSAIENRS